MHSGTPKAKSGAPNKLSLQSKNYAVSLVKRDHANTAVEAAKLLNNSLEKSVSVETVRRALRDVGNLVAKKKIKKPLLKSAHRLNRLKWALEHRDWTIDDWKSVIWSDETKICRFGSDGME